MIQFWLIFFQMGWFNHEPVHSKSTNACSVQSCQMWRSSVRPNPVERNSHPQISTTNYVHIYPDLIGGNSNLLFMFHPDRWGKMNPFWLIFFQIGLVQPPTRLVDSCSTSTHSCSHGLVEKPATLVILLHRSIVLDPHILSDQVESEKLREVLEVPTVPSLQKVRRRFGGKKQHRKNGGWKNWNIIYKYRLKYRRIRYQLREIHKWGIYDYIGGIVIVRGLSPLPKWHDHSA